VRPAIRLHVFIEPGLAFSRDRRAGQHDGLELFQLVAVLRHDAGLLEDGLIGRARAEQVRARVVGHLPQQVRRGPGGIAVIEHRHRVDEQRTGEEVPHHPAGAGEEEHALPRVHVHVEMEQLELFERYPPVAME
jgi:hypothetical protein